MGKALFIAGPAEQYEGWNIGMDNMLFLAGLMGMMALGGAVFVGLSPADDLDEIAARDADGDGEDGSTYQWYMDATPIPNENDLTLEVTENIPLEIEPNKHNEFYLHTKRVKMGHTLELVPEKSKK
jgi:hypothetical protein